LAETEKYVWIRTQDGSPTLWNNEIGEPFRSVKGAFHESLMVFVKPALEFAQKLLETKKEIILCEFGLGAGTNWILFSLAARALRIPFRYFAIEKDTSAFRMSLKKWDEEKTLLEEVLLKHLGLQAQSNTSGLALPLVFPTIDDTPKGFDSLNLDADIWFHDPFGFSVNPDGYSDETLQKCAALWAKPCLGLSYACNSNFQRSLQNLGVATQTVELNSAPLKRESLLWHC
jgi:tRNA U34 5-methylaminomethyl-2-thiouridine-forming methyltransferase MnmC